MGQIVGAAIVSHHPGLMRSKEDRLKLGAGTDSDLIAGFDRIREKIDAVGADTFVIFDTHWITTNGHLVAGLDHYSGIYTSDEVPNVLADIAYDGVAAVRHRLFTRPTDACPILPPALRSRMLP